MQVWLIRHGQSEANAGFSTSMPGEVKLTSKGIEQSEFISEAFSSVPDLVVTSPFIRTQQTAKPTLAKFSNTFSEQWSIQEFTYLSPQRFPNTNTDDRRPFVEAYWARNDPDYNDGQGAESFIEFLHRVQGFAKRLSKRKESFIAVFGHGHFMKAFLWSVISGNSFNHDKHILSGFKHFSKAVKIRNAAIIKLNIIDNNIWLSGISTAHLPDDLIS